MQGKQRKGRVPQGRLESDWQGKTRSVGHVEEWQGSFFTLYPTVFFAGLMFLDAIRFLKKYPRKSEILAFFETCPLKPETWAESKLQLA